MFTDLVNYPSLPPFPFPLSLPPSFSVSLLFKHVYECVNTITHSQAEQIPSELVHEVRILQVRQVLQHGVLIALVREFLPPLDSEQLEVLP